MATVTYQVDSLLFLETWKSVQEKLESDPVIVNQIKSEEIKGDDEMNTSHCLPLEFLEHLGPMPESAPRKNEVITSIVCYGLGNFSSCVIARYQLGFLLLLSNLIQVPHAKCFCYDPRFTKSEIIFLKSELGLSIIKENEEGKRVCREPTLLFMPHCGKPLYNNLLWANWETSLHNLIILGNSFASFQERVTEAKLMSDTFYIASILSFTSEERVKNSFEHRDIFNDLAFHIFNSEKLKEVPVELWQQNAEPSYDHIADVDIILKKR